MDVCTKLGTRGSFSLFRGTWIGLDGATSSEGCNAAVVVNDRHKGCGTLTRK